MLLSFTWNKYLSTYVKIQSCGLRDYNSRLDNGVKQVGGGVKQVGRLGKVGRGREDVYQFPASPELQ